MEITLRGNVQSTNHIYKSTCRGKFASVYMSSTGKSLKEDYFYQLKQQYKKKPITGDIELRIELFFGDKRKRDVDNYNKLILDACSKVLWEDDSQIQSLLVIKNYDSKNPRAELTLDF